jgi:hypothetical protein
MVVFSAGISTYVDAVSAVFAVSDAVEHAAKTRENANNNASIRYFFNIIFPPFSIFR